MAKYEIRFYPFKDPVLIEVYVGKKLIGSRIIYRFFEYSEKKMIKLIKDFGKVSYKEYKAFRDYNKNINR